MSHISIETKVKVTMTLSLNEYVAVKIALGQMNDDKYRNNNHTNIESGMIASAGKALYEHCQESK